jgi:hypothetical protein
MLVYCSIWGVNDINEYYGKDYSLLYNNINNEMNTFNGLNSKKLSKYYKEFNKEISNLNNLELLNHYITIGFIENDKYYKKKIKYFICSKESFYELYSDFDYDFYKNKYFKDSDKDEFEILLYYHQIGKNNKNLINNKYKIIIYTPQINMNCGGIVVLHYLAKIINDLNHSKFYAKLCIFDNLKYKNIFCNEFARIDEINDNSIVIYPEIVFNNPLNCKKVVRWILAKIGIHTNINHHKCFGKNDLIYNWETGKINDKQLCTPYYNDIFIYQNNEKRNLTCYIVKKGRLIHKNIKYIHDKNSIDIEKLSLEEVNNIFNKCKYFYCYDPYCAFATYAVSCGCISIIYPIENISKEEYFKNSMLNYNNKIYNAGIAYGNSKEEIEYGEKTLKEGRYLYKNLYEEYTKESVDNFLIDLEKYMENNN